MIVAAAKELLSRGAVPTVEEAAEAASIARATAYRYFPNRRALLAAAFPEVMEPSLLEDPAPASADDRLDAVISAIGRMLVENEAAFRAMLRMSLEADSQPAELVLRQGRAIGWIEDALAPLRSTMSRSEFRRLVLAIRSATGIEALVWLTDVGGLSRPAACRLMRWSAQAMLQAARAAS